MKATHGLALSFAVLLLASAPGIPSAAADSPTAPPTPWKQLIPREVYTDRDAAISAMSAQLITENPTRFAAHVYKSSTTGQKMPYRLFKPATIPTGTRLPLLLILHGGGSRGTDNLAHITGKHAALTTGHWTTPQSQSSHPCIVLAPQCPPDPAAWTETDWAADHHPHHEDAAGPMKLALEILDEIMKDPAVDPQRIYVLGASMGGFGTWDALIRRPNLFAAAVPACGALSDGQAISIAQIPVWIFHGGSDELVPVTLSRNAFQQLLDNDGHPRYTEYENANHYISSYVWTEPGLADWLFQQKTGK